MAAIRRAVVKQQPVKRVRAVTVPVYHAHGCIKCHLRYSDRCDTPHEDRKCMTCEHGHARSIEQLDRAPKDCCKTHSVLMLNPDELNRYALGGPGPWYQCVGANGCARTHPHKDPTKETPDVDA
jgi:hypothetical protein